jgi:hypothetical protein
MIDAETKSRLLDYDPETGVFTWKPRGRRNSWDARYTGARAGTLENGRIVIRIGNRCYKAHRLAWLYVHGAWPDGHLDHANRSPADNRLANLRLATRSQNAANTRKRSDNTSGFKGVCWNKKTRKWVAQVRVKGEARYLGLFDSPEEAYAAYQQAAMAAFGEFGFLGFLTTAR